MAGSKPYMSQLYMFTPCLGTFLIGKSCKSWDTTASGSSGISLDDQCCFDCMFGSTAALYDQIALPITGSWPRFQDLSMFHLHHMKRPKTCQTKTTTQITNRTWFYFSILHVELGVGWEFLELQLQQFSVSVDWQLSTGWQGGLMIVSCYRLSSPQGFGILDTGLTNCLDDNVFVTVWSGQSQRTLLQWTWTILNAPKRTWPRWTSQRNPSPMPKMMKTTW